MKAEFMINVLVNFAPNSADFINALWLLNIWSLMDVSTENYYNFDTNWRLF